MPRQAGDAQGFGAHEAPGGPRPHRWHAMRATGRDGVIGLDPWVCWCERACRRVVLGTAHRGRLSLSGSSGRSNWYRGTEPAARRQGSLPASDSASNRPCITLRGRHAPARSAGAPSATGQPAIQRRSIRRAVSLMCRSRRPPASRAAGAAAMRSRAAASAGRILTQELPRTTQLVAFLMHERRYISAVVPDFPCPRIHWHAPRRAYPNRPGTATRRLRAACALHRAGSTRDLTSRMRHGCPGPDHVRPAAGAGRSMRSLGRHGRPK